MHHQIGIVTNKRWDAAANRSDEGGMGDYKVQGEREKKHTHFLLFQ